MRLRSRGPLVSLVALALVSVGLLPDTAAAQQAVTVQLAQQNNSGMTGTATLTPMGNQTQVVIQVQNAPGPHPAHIHTGQCPTPGGVAFPLTAISNGRSETMVSAPLNQIQGAQHAINLHKSPQEIPVYTSCGDIPVVAAAAGAPAAAQAAAPAAAPSSQPGALPRTGESGFALYGLAALGALLLLGGARLALRRRSF